MQYIEIILNFSDVKWSYVYILKKEKVHTVYRVMPKFTLKYEILRTCCKQ